MRARWSAVALVAGFAGAGCTRMADLASGTVVTCQSSAECPSGRVCNHGRCQDASRLDTTPPDVVAETLAVTPSRLGPGQTFTVAFEVTEPLAAPPALVLGLVVPAPIPCAETGARRYACTYAATGLENAGRGGEFFVHATLVDLAGNETDRSSLATITLDFEPPALAARTVEPAAVPLGGVIQVFFTANEELRSNPVLVASRPLDDPASPSFVLAPQPGTRNYLLTHLVTQADAGGDVEFTVHMTDVAGNVTTTAMVGAARIDVEPIAISSVVVTPARIGARGTVDVRFETSEVAREGSVTATVGGRPMACQRRATAAPAYACARAMDGGELPPGAGAAQSVVVSLTDEAGNRSTASGSTVFDFGGPEVASASVAYAPPVGSVLASVPRATAGARVTVLVLASEALDGATAPTLAAEYAGSTLRFTFDAAASTSTSAVFEAVVPAGSADGDYAATLAWGDVAGNVTVTGEGLPAIRVKTSAPALVVDQDALVFVRSPWGNAAREPLGGYAIPAGPYFAVEPSDVLTATATLPAGALQLAGGVLPTKVLVQASSGEGAQVLGALEPDAGGRFPRRALVTLDVPGVWLVGVDDAGNRSAPVKLVHAEWVATPNPPAFGASPHTLEWTGYASSTRVQEDALHPAATGDGAGAGGQAVVARAEAVWRDRTWPGRAPDARYGHAMAYDSARGRVVLFGGYGNNYDYRGDTWEWSGRAWTQVATTGPNARYMHAMAYDSARGRVVLFGGNAGSGLGDTWEWSGSAWTQVATAGPGARYGHAMAYDSARGRVVLFGGTGDGGSPGDTWEWDGSAWTQVATAGPGARSGHAIAYDSARRRVVLFGGRSTYGYLDDTWEWSGGAWAQVATTGPSARAWHGMAYDSARGRVVLFGGNVGRSSLGDTWEWSGSAWSQVSTTGPGARDGHAMAYDSARGRVVLFGRYWDLRHGYLVDTWEWSGSAWTQVATSGPSARSGHAMAYDSARQRVVLFGGRANGDTWEWDGSAWTQVATTGPSARDGHAMAYDSGRGRTVLFGGDGNDGHLGDTWEWDGSAWTSVATPGPSARYSHAMAYDSAAHDSARGRVVLFGGSGGSGSLGDTWERDGSAWTQVATTGPSARDGQAMAYDGERRVVLFGGGFRGDTWEWSGSAWTQVATTGPSARDGHAMAYDGARGRVVLFGGQFSRYMADTWEWSGSAWTQVATPGPSARDRHAMAYDSARGRVVLFGGYVGSDFGDTWEYDAAPVRQPAIHFSVSPPAHAGIPTAAIERLRVRAHAGGTFAGGDGATLLAWSSGLGSNDPPGTWLPLAVTSTQAAAQPPHLPADAPAIDWSSSSAADVTRLVVERDGLSFQVRPSGPAGPDLDGARVVLDAIEVRVRYTVP